MDGITTAAALQSRVRELEAGGDEAAVEMLLRRAGAEPLLHEAAATLLRERMVADGAIAAAVSRWPSQPGDRRPFALISRAIAAHLRGDFAQAAHEAADALHADAADTVALNHRARALHNLGRREEAMAAFRAAVRLDPDAAIAWHNLGQALRAAGAMPEAVQAFARAASLRPGFRSAALNHGKTLLLAGNASAALETFDRWLQRQQDDTSAALDRALALHQLGRLGDSIEAYRAVCAAAPGDAHAWYCLGAALNEQGASEAARAALERAIAIAPGDADAWAELAAVHEFDNRLDAADDAVQRGMAVAPGHPRLLLEAARMERRRGRATQAAAVLARLDPEQMPPRARAGYWFERGRSLDLTGDTGQAFQAFERGNREARRALSDRRVESSAQPQLVEATQRWLAAPASASWLAPGAAPDPAAPVFLMGFARSGITLLNIMLGCLQDVQTLEERPTVESVCAGLDDYPGILDRLEASDVAGLRDRYWQLAESFGASRGGPQRLVDMYPLRTPLLPVVARLFPGATLVFVRRHPCDVVLSNFMQHYAMNAATSQFLDLASTVQFYCQTMELWLALRDRLPLERVEVAYESLAQAPEPTLRTLLAGLRLPWDPAVLRHSQRLPQATRVSTSSYHQVAQPVYASAVGRWRRYEGQLAPWLPRLLPLAEALGYPR